MNNELLGAILAFVIYFLSLPLVDKLCNWLFYQLRVKNQVEVEESEEKK